MALTQVTNDMLAFDGGAFSFRNKIINGDMRIDQRNAGASVACTSSAAYNVDRWSAGMSGANGTMQRVSSGRTDFSYALRLTGTTSTTTAWCSQKIEAANAFDLVGQSITISFFAAASTLTGVGVNLSYANAADNFSAMTSIGTQGKTINSTLTQYTVTFNNLPAGVANGLYIEFVPSGSLGTGTFTLTGVQLEVGSVATPFERRPYGMELSLCQRYYWRVSGSGTSVQVAIGWCESTTRGQPHIRFPVTMRQAPVGGNSTITSFTLRGTTTNVAVSTAPAGWTAHSPENMSIEMNTATAFGVAGGCCCLFSPSTAWYVDASAEL